MIRIKHSCVLFYLCVSLLKGQDIHFSQFYESPLLLNPAAAGAINSDFRFVANYKNQWKSIINPFKTLALAFDTKIYLNKKRKGNYIGAGVTLFNDKVGMAKFTTNQLNADVAYHVFFDRHNSLSAGIKAGFFERHINPADLKWDKQYNGKTYDASLPNGENMVLQSYGKFDLGAGLLYSYNNTSNGLKLQAGVSMAHITKPKNSFYLLDPTTHYKYTGHFHLQYKLEDQNLVLMPAALYVKQGGHSEIVAGSNFKFILGEETRDKVILNTFTLISSSIQFGAFYRFKDAIIFTSAIEYRKNMQFGVSYDVNVSRLTAASKYRGGLEFSFVLTGLSASGTKGNRNDR